MGDDKVPVLYALVLSFLGALPSLGSTDDRGQMNSSVATIITAFIGVILLIAAVELFSGVSSDYFNSTDNISQDFENANFTDDTLTNIADPFGLLVGVVLILGFVLIILKFVDV